MTDSNSEEELSPPVEKRGRGRQPGFKMTEEHKRKIAYARLGYRTPPFFYVYRLFDHEGTLYVGKGSDHRLKQQKNRFKLAGEIIERCYTEAEAYEREIYWIAQLNPPLNKSSGGTGFSSRQFQEIQAIFAG